MMRLRLIIAIKLIYTYVLLSIFYQHEEVFMYCTGCQCVYISVLYCIVFIVLP